VSPGGQTINLVDDGTGADQAAGDGIYTAQWSPPGPGNFTLTFPTGNPVQVTVLSNYMVGEVSPTYQTISGTNLNLGDDDVATLTSPFPIQFGGGSFSTLYVSSNGTISFSNPFGDYINLPLPLNVGRLINPVNPPPPPEDQPVVTLLAPFWEDLFPVKGTAQNVFWDVIGAAPGRQLVIEWRNVGTYLCRGDLSANVTFQVVFKEGGSDFQFNYSNVIFGAPCSDQDFGNAATVGIQINQNVGTQWSDDQPALANGTSLVWTIPPVNPTPNPVPTITSISPTSILFGAVDVLVTINGTGFVAESRANSPSQFGILPFPTIFQSTTELQIIVQGASSTNPNGGTVPVQVTNPAPGGGKSQIFSLTLQGTTPQITSISPSSIPAGSFGFVLTINGSGFAKGANVVFDGSGGGTATFLSPNQLTMPVPGSMLVNPHTYSVQVQNPFNTSGGGGNFSNGVPLTVTFAAAPAALAVPVSAFTPASGSATQPKPQTTPLPARFQGWNFALKMGGAYLNQFLRPLARGISSPQTSTATTLANTATAQQSTTPPPVAGLSLRPTLPAGFLPAAIATGDFNGDGKMDWAVANAGSNSIWIYLGNGDGTAQLPLIVPLRGQAPVALVATDMNHDGKLDLVVAEADSIMVAVLLGKGDGTFAPELQFAAPNPPVSLAVADFDGDGNPDVVAGLLSTPLTGQLAFFHGDGTGKLKDPISRDTVINPYIYLDPISLSAADLNGDGRPDIVVLDLGVYGFNGENLQGQEFNAGARVYLNQGDGTFKLSQQFFFDQTADQTSGLLGVAATALALGDVNKDGCIDAVTLDTSGTATFFPGRCNGTFDTTNTRIFATGIVAGAAILVDMNKDGNLDLVSSAFTFADTPPYQSSDGNSVSLQLGDGTGNFGSPKLFRGESGMFSLAVAPLIGGGAPDVITANQSSDSVSVYLNDGTGNLGSPNGAYLGYLAGGQMHAVANAAGQFFAAVDVNGDGKRDLITMEAGAQYPLPVELTVLLGDGTGHFGSPVRSPIFESDVCDGLCFAPSDLALEDVRNVGLPDLLIYSSGSLGYSKNNGDGTFQKMISTPLNFSYSDVVIGDFNGDHKPDLVFLQTSVQPGQTATVAVIPLFGNGDGTFTQGPPTPLNVSGSSANPGYVYTIRAADVNHDGKLDLLGVGSGTSSTAQNALYEFLGNGDGTFQPPKLLFNNFSAFFAVADVNHDGNPDVVEAVQGALNPDLLVYPWQYQIFLGQPDGTFQVGNTYGPYQLPIASGFFAGTPDRPLRPPQPLLADFNGDGNPDIAVYQSGVQVIPTYFGSTFGPTSSSLQILAGNGDGTFTPSSISYSLGRFDVPELAADVNGDNRADLVEMNGYTSSYDIIPAVPGSTFVTTLVADQVIGAKGRLRIILANPASTTTTFAVSASDPNISIPATISVPAGSITQDTDFQVGSSFNANRVFAINVTLGLETHVAYGTQATSSLSVGFQAQLATTHTPVILPSQSTPNYGVSVGSMGGYSTVVQFSCQGMPAHASCQFGENSAALGAGEIIENSLVVNTDSSIAPGYYSFTLVISDGVISINLPALFNVGDFTMSLSPLSETMGTTDYTHYSLILQGLYGFRQAVQISCSGWPTGAPCPASIMGPQFPNSQGLYFQVHSTNAVPGTYTVTLTGISGPLVRAASAQLVITSGSFSGTVFPTSATIAVNSSRTFNVQIQSVDAFQGDVSLSCLNPSVGISCQFGPTPVYVGANSNVTSTLTVTVTAKPTSSSFLPSVPRHLLLIASERISTIFVFLSILILLTIRLLGSEEKKQQKYLEFVLAATLFALALELSSCSGGGSNSGGGGNGSGGGFGSSPVSVPLAIQGSSGSTVVNLGNVTITVP
jgi:hypothetical protein